MVGKGVLAVMLHDVVTQMVYWLYIYVMCVTALLIIPISYLSCHGPWSMDRVMRPSEVSSLSPAAQWGLLLPTRLQLSTIKPWICAIIGAAYPNSLTARLCSICGPCCGKTFWTHQHFISQCAYELQCYFFALPALSLNSTHTSKSPHTLSQPLLIKVHSHALWLLRGIRSHSGTVSPHFTGSSQEISSIIIQWDPLLLAAQDLQK